MADIEVEKVDLPDTQAKPTLPPAPVPTPPPAPPTVVFRDQRETPLQSSRGDVEELIRKAGEPFDEVVRAWADIQELEVKLRAGRTNLHAFRRDVMDIHSRVQKALGRAEGYKAALAVAVSRHMREKEVLGLD